MTNPYPFEPRGSHLAPMPRGSHERAIINLLLDGPKFQSELPRVRQFTQAISHINLTLARSHMRATWTYATRQTKFGPVRERLFRIEAL